MVFSKPFWEVLVKPVMLPFLLIALIGEGRTNNAIAVQLGIAPETIKTYLKRIFVKLGTHSRAEAVVLAQGPAHCPSTTASSALLSLDMTVGGAV